MRILFAILVILHGLIHLLGFIKGLGLGEVKELTIPVSKPAGLAWLATTALFLVFGMLFLIHNTYAWLAGLAAVVISQVLVILFWNEAKFGTLPNLVIFVVSIVLFGYFNFQRLVTQETKYLLSFNTNAGSNVLLENELIGLPEPVKNWLRASGSIGKPIIHTGRVLQHIEMQLKPDQKGWMTATAVQYTTTGNPSFIWKVDVMMNRFFSMQGRDKFADGKGEMMIKLHSLINVVKAKGEKINEGSLQRYLGEMVWFPTLALSPYIRWEEMNDTTAKATMACKGTEGSGTFYFNAAGDVTKYVALRYRGNETGSRRQEWIMKIDGYRTFEGRKVPAIMNATWRLDERDWTWLKLEVTDIRYNENAGH